jgi:hypothetical protein
MAADGRAPVTVDRQGVLRFRVRRQELDRPAESGAAGDVALLDYGVQDTGPDGAPWALAIRGALPPGPDELAYAWTLRGAPHAYRRADMDGVAVATAPFSEADAAKRIFDAARPLRAAGIPALKALRVVARHLGDIAAEPIAKGEASTRLTSLLDEPYLRSCRPCDAIHAYEMPFRLAALHAGLELEAGTSPPVLRRLPGADVEAYDRLGGEASPRLDVIRNHLRFYGPARMRDVAAFLDAPVREVKAHWPDDAVEVEVTEESDRGAPRFVLAEDADTLVASAVGDPVDEVRLLGPYDPYLQLRDRELLVADEARRKDLWRVLGRPGAILVDGEVVGTWRPRTSGGRLTLRVEPWRRLGRPLMRAVHTQAERLAAYRVVTLAAITEG